MDRREFLRIAGAGSLAQAAAPAAPTVIRVGMLGTGHSHTTGKLKAMQDSPDYEIAGVVKTMPMPRASPEKDPRFQGLKWMSEDQLLADRSIHLIVVECRVWEALPWGRKVIDAGKHLHLEKPPGNEWEPFKELVEEARRKKLLLQTGYVWRWHEGVNAAHRSGPEGLARGSVHGPRNDELGSRPEERATEAKYKGGGLFELSGHVIDRTVELLGRPKTVKSWLRHDTNHPDKLADNNLTVFEYDKSAGGDRTVGANVGFRAIIGRSK